MKLVGVIGFEPTTPSSRTRCATRLRYTPTEARLIAAARRGRKHAAPDAGSRWPTRRKRLPNTPPRCAIADLPERGRPARQGLHRRHRRGDRLRRRPALEPDRAALRRAHAARAARAASSRPAARGCRRRWRRFANGALAHAFEMDNLTWPNTGVHPGATMFVAGAGGGAGARHRRPRADRGVRRRRRDDDPHRPRDQAQQRRPRLPCARHHRAVRRRGRGRAAAEVRRRHR